MKKINVILAFLVLFLSLGTVSVGQGQGEYPTGLNFDLQTYNSEKVLTYDFGRGAKGGDMPFTYSLKDYAPQIGDQGRIGSCVGWSVGYANLTIMYAKLNGWDDMVQRTQLAFSALYIYNNIRRGGCSTGATLEDAGAFLQKNGDYLSSQFDSPNDACSRNADNTFREAAKNYKIKGYFKVFNTDNSGKTKVYNVKKHLSKGYPVVIGLSLRKNFFYPRGIYWDPATGNTQPAGSHAMVIVGYDDTKQAFEVMNSWGTNWGNNGYIWIKYKDFQQFALGAYRYIINEDTVLDPEDNNDDPNPDIVTNVINYHGSFQFGIPVFNDDESISFKKMKPIKSGEYSYKLEKKDWEVGDMYQLMVKETQKSRAVYVFSIDGEGSNIHWPRDPELNSKFNNLSGGEAHVIPFDDVEILIPGENRALTKRIEGDDNICILYAYGEIKDFKERVERVKNATGSIDERFRVGFGDMIVPAEDLNFLNGKMQFNGQSQSGRHVVPILLTIEGE